MVRRQQLRTWVTRVLELLVLLTVLSLVVGQLLGQPVLLGYVETGSMQPTLDPGDGFVAVPAGLSDTEVGDVVVFRAQELHGGGLTTHRVVDVTERGYITRGDANTFTDQAGEEPPVSEAQVVAEVLQVGGHVVVVPELGTGAHALRDGLSTLRLTATRVPGVPNGNGNGGLALVFLVVGVLGYAGSVVRERARSSEQATPASDEDGTSEWSDRQLVGALVLVVLVVTTASMVLPGGVHEYDVVSADNDAPGPRVIPTGESEQMSLTVRNGGLLPTVVYLSPGSEGVTVSRHSLTVAGQSSAEVTVTLSAPAENGYYHRYVVERRYLVVLPPAVIHRLHAVHPWLPIVAVNAVVGGGFALLAVLVDRLNPGKRGDAPRTERP